jgi:hypothetical protein
MNYAIINAEGLVINVVEWDGNVGWQPPDDCIIEPMAEGGIGWTYVDGALVPPVTIEEPPAFVEASVATVEALAPSIEE